MRIDINQAEPGMILDATIYDGEAVLLPSGKQLTEKGIDRLKRFGITYIDIVSEQKEKALEETKKEVKTTVSSELVQEMKDALVTNNMEKIDYHVTEIVTSVLTIVKEQGTFANLIYDLRSYENKDDTLSHSIRVAIFSIVLAELYNEILRNSTKDIESLKGKLIDYKQIAMASLLHERGRNCYRQDVLQSARVLSHQDELCRQFPGIKEIPTDHFDDRYISFYSYCIVKDIPNISAEVGKMVLFSSETENNKGPLRPLGFSSQNPNNVVMGAKIIYLCSLYDDVLAHCVCDHQSLENVVGVLGQLASTGVVNTNLVNLFLSNIPMYPIGTKVMLSNGEIATVLQSFIGYTNAPRPIVKIDRTNEVIDLRSEFNLTITYVSTKYATLSEVVDGQVQDFGQGRK